MRRLTALNVILLALIVVSGAAVRLTDSGLGCPEWPRCNPEDFVSVGSSSEAIEQLNRIFSGLIGIPILATIVAAYRQRPRRTDLIVAGWAMLGLFFSNAIVGGISVQLELAWFAVLGHFLLAIALLAVALFAHKRAGEPPGPRRSVVHGVTLALAGAVYLLTLAALVLGTLVTAAGPHGGDEDAKRLGWQIDDIARVHSLTVDTLIGCTVVLVLLLVRARAQLPPATLTTASFALATMVGQAILGYVQYARGVPELLVGIHVAGAVTVFGAVQWLLLSLRVPVDSGATEATVEPGELAVEFLRVPTGPAV